MAKTVAKMADRSTNGVHAGEDVHEEAITIASPNMKIIPVQIRGMTPLVLNRFGSRAKQQIHETQEAGRASTSKKKREPKNFQAQYEDAKHISRDGWLGIHAACFRNGMIDMGRLVDFKMTQLKLAVFILADGYGVDNEPLIRITKGEPEYYETSVRLATGTIDLRARPLWQPGWEATVRIRFDGDMLKAGDVVNLMARLGMQGGIGEGRPNSKDSKGTGFGLFEVVG